MRITFLNPPANLSGGNRVVAIHAQRLQQRGHSVCLVSQPATPPSLRDQLREVARGLRAGRITQPWLRKGERGKNHFDGLDVEHIVIDEPRPILARDVPDADVVVATWWETAFWAAALPWRKGAKAYFVQHHEVFDYLPRQRVRETYTLPLHKIVVSDWLASVMAEEYGDTRVSLVPNGVDAEHFHTPARGKQARPTVGMLYSPVNWKGADIGIAAYEAARRVLPDLQLVTFGDSPEQPGVRLPETCRHNVRPDQALIPGIYASCDAWLFPSRSEGFGLPILEAMACRTPVIGVPTGAAPELLADGGGLLVPPEDPQAMAQAIERVCTLSEPDWRVLSEAARQGAQKHSWESATLLFEAALDEAVARRDAFDFVQPRRTVEPDHAGMPIGFSAPRSGPLRRA